jgi:hypothetical protein
MDFDFDCVLSVDYITQLHVLYTVFNNMTLLVNFVVYLLARPISTLDCDPDALGLEDLP